MADLIRFGVAMEKKLLDRFDREIKEKNYSNRSEAIRDLIRKNLIEQEWEKKGEVSGAIVFVYNHHKRELVNTLMDIQHDFHEVIISTQHIHLDHDNCLEIVVVKGGVEDVKKLFDKLRSAKGVKHCTLAKTTIGRDLV